MAFERVGDRFRHVVGCYSAGEFTPLIASVEGDAARAWPPSPPLQQLHIEPRGEQGDVALLVGMAGRSHWSLSVEPYRHSDGSFAGFVFDVACRSTETPELLGAAYTAMKGVWQLEGSGRALLKSPDVAGQLVIEQLTEQLADAGSIGYEIKTEGAELALVAAHTESPASTAVTRRWRYRIHWRPMN